MKVKQNIFIDFLGYEPMCRYLCCKEGVEGIKWFHSETSVQMLKKFIKENEYTVIPNPRFVNFQNHIDFVNELNN